MVPRSRCRPVPVEPVLVPDRHLPGAQVATPLLDHQGAEPANHVVVDLAELGGGVPGAEVVSPPAQHGIEIRDHLANVRAPTRLRPVRALTFARSRFIAR